MYAVIETGGKQYRVEPGETILVEKLDAEEGAEVSLDKVVALAKGADTIVGSPYVENASVSAEVVGLEKGKKKMVFKQKPRKGFRCLRGHRQRYTKLKIKDIQGV